MPGTIMGAYGDDSEGLSTVEEMDGRVAGMTIEEFETTSTHLDSRRLKPGSICNDENLAEGAVLSMMYCEDADEEGSLALFRPLDEVFERAINPELSVERTSGYSLITGASALLSWYLLCHRDPYTRDYLRDWLLELGKEVRTAVMIQGSNNPGSPRRYEVLESAKQLLESTTKTIFLTPEGLAIMHGVGRRVHAGAQKTPFGLPRKRTTQSMVTPYERWKAIGAVYDAHYQLLGKKPGEYPPYEKIPLEEIYQGKPNGVFRGNIGQNFLCMLMKTHVFRIFYMDAQTCGRRDAPTEGNSLS